MNKQSILLQVLFIFLILGTIISSAQLPLVSAQGKDGIDRHLNAESGKVSFIGPESGRSMAFSQAMGALPGAGRPADPALALAKHFAPEFGIRDASKELSAMQTNHPGNGRVTVRYQQDYQGVPVMGGELIVNTNENGDLYSINGEVSPNLSLSTQPTVDADQARQIALQMMAKWNEKRPEDFIASEPALWIFDESLLQPSNRPVELVWRMDVTSADDSLPVRELMLINARTGNPDFHFNQIDTEWNLTDRAGAVNVPSPTSARNRDVAALSVSTWYVDAATGSDANPCTLASPCASIQKAIDIAPAEDIIWVTSGVYSNDHAYMTRNVVLEGGWNSGFTLQNGQSIIDAGNLQRSAQISSGISVSMDHFDLRNGKVVFDDGGGVLNSGAFTFTNGAIYNNSAHGYSSGETSDGGGIYSNGTQLTLTNATISNNEADTGGGIFVSSGSTTLNDVTITQNFATNIGVVAYGGGIQNISNSPFTISNTLIAGNAAEVGQDCSGQITSGGNNLIGFVPGCDITALPSDLVGTQLAPVEAKLGNLGDNNSSTRTHALLAGSPALDAGNPATCATTDQRGVTRPQGAACDIGAFEGSASQTITVNAKTYSAGNASKWPGSLVCDMTQPNCTNGVDPTADQAQNLAIETYDFYLSNHNRNGIDKNNMPIISTVHYCSASGCPYGNAFWSGAQMVYGDAYGFANADDVIAHELTHGVTQYESNLFYFYQSGAINESFSDVWGEYFDQSNGLGNDSPGVKWLIGEDISGWGAIRNMKNPPQFGDPDKMTSPLYNKKPFYDPSWDNGGVHYNSGVNNKAVYLMVDGGTFNSKTVTGLGWEKVGAIYYETQTNLLSSGADYSDLYYALQQACTNLIGQHGITTADCLEVKDAVDAVQMNSQPISNFNPDVSLCPTGMTTADSLSLFKDNFENGSGNWSTSDATVWSLQETYASSPTHMFWGDDSFPNNDQTLGLTNGISLPPGTTPFLHFKHAFAFEHYATTYWDGGVLEYFKGDYDAHGDPVWFDAKPLFSGGQNYKGTVYQYAAGSESYGSALQGHLAFVGDSHGYVSSRYNLTSLTGKTVQFRWRFSTDYTGNYGGWYVDDVQVYTCAGVPSIPKLQMPANNSLTTNYAPLINWVDTAPVADHYQVQVDNNADFSSPAVDDNTPTISQYQISSALASNARYYWRVRSYNAVDGTNGWSAVWSFRTALTPPTLSGPVDGFTSPELRPLFDWDDVSTATGYTIQISRNSTFTQIVRTGNPVGSSYIPTSDLPKYAGTPLYWRVLTRGANGPSLYSAYRSFTTPSNPPPAPVLLAPTSNALQTNYRPTFTWKALAFPSGTFPQNYIIQIDDSATFNSPEVDDSSPILPTFTPSTDLAPNMRFFWRVRAVNTLGEMSNWSPVRYFRSAILPPTPNFPADDSTSVSRTPLLDWSDVSGNNGYAVQVWKAGTTPVLVKTATLPTNVSQYQFITNLLPNTAYFWMVRTRAVNGPSSWSQDFDFTTGP